MEKNKDKRTSLEIEHVYYPIIIAIFSFIFAYSYIGNSFERDVTYLGSSDYGQGARDNITVVYMDEIFLDDIESIKFLGQEYVDWPLPYKTQAAIFNRILKYKPKAIFIDLAYLKQRENNTELSYLSEGFVENAKHAGKEGAEVPIFLAALETTVFDIQHNAHQHIRLPLEKFNQITVPTLVGWDNSSSHYPLTMNVAGTEYPTAAFALYQSVCAPNCNISNRQSSLYKDALAIQWPDRDTRYLIHTSDNNENTGCHSSNKPFWRKTLVLFRQKLKSVVATQNYEPSYCPPVDTVHASILIDPNTHHFQKSLRELIEGRVILIGASVLGAEDLIFTPTHGMQPGVYLHAMALDNLLHYGIEYPRDPVFNVHINLWIPAFFEFIMLLGVGVWRWKTIPRVNKIRLLQSDSYKAKYEAEVVVIEKKAMCISSLIIIFGLIILKFIYYDISLLGLFVIGFSYFTLMLSLAPKYFKNVAVSVLRNWRIGLLFLLLVSGLIYWA